MACKIFFTNHDKHLIFLSLILISIGLISDFISTIVWWLRIQPWLSHSKYQGKFVYYSTIICWILSLISLLIIIIYIILMKVYKSQFQNKFIIFICVFSLLSSISAITSSFYALKNEKVSLGKFGKLNNKCYSYVLQYSTIKQWAVEHKKEKEFEPWYSNLVSKISNCKSNDCDHKNPYNDYLCLQVGIPTLLFAIVQIFGVSLLITTLIIIRDKSKDNFTLFDNQQN